MNEPREPVIAGSAFEWRKAVVALLLAFGLGQAIAAFSLVTLREAAQGTVMEHAYQISVVTPDLRSPLVTSLQAVPGVHDVTLLLQEPTLDL